MVQLIYCISILLDIFCLANKTPPWFSDQRWASAWSDLSRFPGGLWANSRFRHQNSPSPSPVFGLVQKLPHPHGRGWWRWWAREEGERGGNKRVPATSAKQGEKVSERQHDQRRKGGSQAVCYLDHRYVFKPSSVLPSVGTKEEKISLWKHQVQQKGEENHEK